MSKKIKLKDLLNENFSGAMMGAMHGDDDASGRLEIIERKLSRMGPDDPEMPALLKESRTLRRNQRKVRLEKELEDMNNGTDTGGLF